MHFVIVSTLTVMVEALRLKSEPEISFCVMTDPPENTKGGIRGKFPIHTQLRFPCIPGYTADGVATGPDFVQLECGKDGNFLPSNLFLGACQPVNCGHPPEIHNARISVSPGVLPETVEVEFGGFAEFACVGNFTTPGGTNFRLACKSDGTFETPPGCEPVGCGLPPVQPNATAMEKISVRLGESMRYMCDPGFEAGPEKFSYDLECGWYPTDQAPYFVGASRTDRCVPISS